jgi:gingipain R
VISNSADEIVFEYVLPKFDTRNVVVDGKTYTEISVPGATTIRKPGMPQLPLVVKSLAIDRFGDYTAAVEVLESSSFDLGVPLPSRGDVERTVQPGSMPLPVASFYSGDETFPASHFEAGTPFVMRDVRGLHARIMPISYNAATGETEVVTRMRVVLTRSHESIGTNALQYSTPVAADFGDIYKGYFANTPETAGFAGSADFPAPYTAGSILIITADEFAGAIAPLAQWKRERGFPTRVVNISEIGRKPKADEVYKFIKKEFEKSHFAHVILVGDAEFVPTRPGTAGNVEGRAADPTYVNLVGNDDYPDAMISRFSAKTVKDAEVMVQRSLRYERQPETGDEWFSRHLGIASNETSSETEPRDWERMRQNQEVLKLGDYKKFIEVFDPKATSRAVQQAVDDGVGFINYMGHGSAVSWITSGFSNSQVARLKNSRWPVILSVACVNGAFASEQGDAFAEAWTKAGTVKEPTGALAMFASSTNQSWIPPALAQKKALEFLASRARTNVGEIFFSASLAALDENSDTAVQTFQSWHSFGDGTAQLHTQTPKAVKPVIEKSLVEGLQTLRLSGLPPHALVAVTAGETVLAAAYDNAAGEVELAVTIPKGTKQVKVTISGLNILPWQQDLTVAP